MLKPKNRAHFFTSLDESMKANLSQKAMKFTEELVGISWIEFKLFISNWKRFDLYFPLLKPKKQRSFFFFLNESFCMKYQSKRPPNDNCFTGRYLMSWIQIVYFQLKEIWPLFSPAKAKKPRSFFTSLPPKQMKTWKYAFPQTFLHRSKNTVKVSSHLGN